MCNNSPQNSFIAKNFFKTSQKALLNAHPSSNDLQIPWVIDNNRLIHKPPRLKPDQLFAREELNISLAIALSNVLPKIKIKEIGP